MTATKEQELKALDKIKKTVKEDSIMEKRYFINYNTGAGNKYAETLEEAKTIAEESMAYTQQNVDIYDCETEEVITTSHWWGVEPEYDEDSEEYEFYVLCQFGDWGYYERWSDELAEWQWQKRIDKTKILRQHKEDLNYDSNKRTRI